MSHPPKHLQHAQYGNKLYFAVSSSWFILGLRSEMIPLASQVWKEWICSFMSIVQHKIIWWLLETQSGWVYRSGKQSKDVFSMPAPFGKCRRLLPWSPISWDSVSIVQGFHPSNRAGQGKNYPELFLAHSRKPWNTHMPFFSGIKPNWKLQESRTKSTVVKMDPFPPPWAASDPVFTQP